MEKAILIGTTRLILSPDKVLHIWLCPECKQLFYCSQSKILKIILCPKCHRRIKLDKIIKEID